MNFRKASRKGRESDNDEKVVSCYGCGKVGHYKSECPKLAKERGRSGANRSLKGRSVEAKSLINLKDNKPLWLKI